MVTLLSEHPRPAAAGGPLPASLDVKISFGRKVCPSLAIQKRKMEFKVTVVNEIALGFHVLEKEKRILRKY